jgi:hypothetical protein
MVRTILGKPLHVLLELSRQGQGIPNGVGGIPDNQGKPGGVWRRDDFQKRPDLESNFRDLRTGLDAIYWRMLIQAGLPTGQAFDEIA